MGIYAASPYDKTSEGAMQKLSRRGLFRLAGLGALLSTGLPTDVKASFLDKFFGRPARVTPPITPNDQFYITLYDTTPEVDVKSWSLTIKGLVQKPIRLNYHELLRRPTMSEIVTLECIGNGIGGDSISNAKWEGIRLKDLLQEAGPLKSANEMIMRAADGYSDSFPLKRALEPDVLLAHRMNNVPLPKDHGYPARIIVPGIYGMKNVKWLTEIELADYDYKGYWEKRGWSDEARVKIHSRIDAPGDGEKIAGRATTIRGIAFSGPTGISRVEVSTDGGRSYQEARLEPALSPYAWVLWSLPWQIPGAGGYTLVVRATDQTGRPQDPMDRDTYPDGATGLHTISVTVK